MKKAVLFFVILFSFAYLSAEETNKTKITIISSEGDINYISVNEIIRYYEGFNISYSFDNRKFIGDQISINIWIEDENKSIIKKITDHFNIKKDGLIERVVFLKFPGEAIGDYTIIFQAESESELLKEKVELEKPIERSITGNVVIENPRQKMIGYVIFLLILVIGVFLIAKNRKKKSFSKKQEKENKENNDYDEELDDEDEE